MAPTTSGGGDGDGRPSSCTVRPTVRSAGRPAGGPTGRGTSLLPEEVEQLDLLRGWTVDELAHEVVNLRRAIASNRRIGAAVGVVMHERGVDYDEAFGLLRRASQDSNVPLVEVAQTVLHLRRMWS